ncbi:MAG: NAD+ synthase [Candidatus Nanopelagicales bacterium]
MDPIRVALAQINPTVGDLAGNAALILDTVSEAAASGANVVLFPEMALTGYPIEDLALRESFQNATERQTSELARAIAAAGHGALTVVLGVLAQVGGQPRNAAAVINGGAVTATYLKHHLPNYGVFDEQRLFAAGNEPCVIDIAGHRCSIAICEDLWQTDSPAELAAKDCELLLVINASPFEQGKHGTRLELCQQRAREADVGVLYVNCVGGQDELVFDGGSMAVRPDGSVATNANRFDEQLLMVDVDAAGGLESGAIGPSIETTEEVYRAVKLGLRDYVRKNGLSSVVLGLSGGIDSALVAAIACDALGAENVHGAAMPSVYSSGHSVEDAHDLAERTGLHIRTVPIASIIDAYQGLLNLSGLAEENLQARVRGTTLMAISNAEGHLVLATGNKSELAVGYSTIYGDAVGGFGPIKDVPKTLVWKLARWRNDRAEALGEVLPIPPRSIDKPPSAELRPDQLDTDSLPDYEELDAILTAYVEGRVDTRDLVELGFDPQLAERIVRLTDAAEYKRRQYPPGTKITRLAFGRDRRLPVTNRWREPIDLEPSNSQ